jgi:hypothetical protein
VPAGHIGDRGAIETAERARFEHIWNCHKRA